MAWVLFLALGGCGDRGDSGCSVAGNALLTCTPGVLGDDGSCAPSGEPEDSLTLTCEAYQSGGAQVAEEARSRCETAHGGCCACVFTLDRDCSPCVIDD